MKGDVALQIPAGVVSDAAGTPNVASETVMISVDTKTALPLAVVDAPEVVLGTGEVTVSVPFAQDGLRYVGENPPYLTIYLGDEVPANARHAVWQSESPGSTIVQFVYTGDDIGGLVSADMASLAIPAGTTLVVSDSLRQAGRAPVASGPGEVARSSPDMPMLSIVARSGEALSPVQFIPWLPTEESEPKSTASSVPRTPIVFNELGNGSGDTNRLAGTPQCHRCRCFPQRLGTVYRGGCQARRYLACRFPRCECAGEWLVAAHEHAFGQKRLSPAAMTLPRRVAIREGKG